MTSSSRSVADSGVPTDTATATLLARRARYVSPSLSIMYPDDPIHVVRARGQYMYDAAGRQYLDCVNNVAHVGHSHPKVNDAISRQLALVNTNTRFLYEPLVDYAERLASLLPDPLEVCFFVNSGSEANELALRLARAHTGRHGVVVQQGAYHGQTISLVDISPYKFDGPGGAGRPDHVQVVPTPDPYRGLHQGDDAGRAYSDEVEEALLRAVVAGHPAGAFVAESLMGTAGQIEPPPGYLAAAYRHARTAGAVVIADEVQIGFGRVGSHFWAFQAQDACPDIVTLGKPIGNSYPLGAVVTTAAIAASFRNGMEYFNTFGGSPAGCAAGLAVLDVIADEELQEHARSVGAHLTETFRELASRHECIGDVRGSGLFLGVEFVSDRTTREPATALARQVSLGLRERHILLSTEGPADNVLKLKPPLPFTQANADQLVDAVDQILQATP